MNVAEYISKRLLGAGVRYIYGIPGGPSIPYLEAFRNEGIEFILTSDERSAGFMADVTSRISGTPGACHATFGPGALNLLSGTGSAMLDRSPVIALTSEMADEWMDRTTQMNVNHQKLFGSLVKATIRLSEFNVRESLGHILEEALNEYPGPVHAGLPAGLAVKNLSVTGPELPERTDKATENEGTFRDAVRLLRKSEKPVLVAGLSASRLVRGGEFENMINSLHLPVLLTPMAKGIIDERNPFYGGVLFHALSDRLKELYSDCDLVIGFGYDQVEYNYESWLPDGVPVLHLDTVIRDLPEGNIVTPYAGKPSEWFKILSELTPPGRNKYKPNLKRIHDEMDSSFRSCSGRFGPVTVLKTLRESFPYETYFTADVGSHLHVLGQYWKTYGRKRLIMTNGWSSMGFGIPASIAAGLNNPGSKIVCITGDGGFLMSAGELLTARRLKIPVIIVVLSDGELNLIKIKQSWQGLEPNSTVLYEGDLFGSDSFLGIKVYRATSEKTLIKALQAASDATVPVIINAVIDSTDYDDLIVRQ